MMDVRAVLPANAGEPAGRDGALSAVHGMMVELAAAEGAERHCIKVRLRPQSPC